MLSLSCKYYHNPFLCGFLIICSDEPKGAGRPFKNKTLPPRTTRAIFEESDTPSRSSATPVACPSTPVSRRVGGKPATPRSRNEKAKVIEKITMLHIYAEELFADLNKTVFKNRLPASTKLNWNKRLLKTAGRAKYHRCVRSVLSAHQTCQADGV